MSGMLRDITDRKEAEERLRQAKQAAEEASQAKDRFLATLSHELRTPLTPVLAVAASLEEDSRLPERLRSDLAMIRRNVELEARLIDDLLDLTRVAHGKLDVVLANDTTMRAGFSKASMALPSRRFSGEQAKCSAG